MGNKVAAGFDGELDPQDVDLLRKWRRGEITREQMLELAQNPEALKRVAGQLPSSQTSSTSPLKLPPSVNVLPKLPQGQTVPPNTDMARFLDATLKYRASDLHLAPGRPASVRIRGDLHNLGQTPLTADDTSSLMKSIATESQQQELSERGEVSFTLVFEDRALFRVAIFRKVSVIGLALRPLSQQWLSLEEIGLPPVVKDLCMRPRGLILVTGAIGSGKSMTLASMIDFINCERADHIVTIEDPIEHYHPHRKCMVSQREVKTSVPSFAEGLRHALRIDPDVILLSDLPDAETLERAMEAAQAGCLVLGSMRTTGAVEAIEQIVDAFPPERAGQIQRKLSKSLTAIISQTLLPDCEGKGRVAAVELMFVNKSIKALIRAGEFSKITAHIQEGSNEGMIPLDDSLFRLWKAKLVTYHDIMRRALDPEALEKRIRDDTEEMRGRRGP